MTYDLQCLRYIAFHTLNSTHRRISNICVDVIFEENTEKIDNIYIKSSSTSYICFIGARVPILRFSTLSTQRMVKANSLFPCMEMKNAVVFCFSSVLGTSVSTSLTRLGVP